MGPILISQGVGFCSVDHELGSQQTRDGRSVVAGLCKKNLSSTDGIVTHKTVDN